MGEPALLQVLGNRLDCSRVFNVNRRCRHGNILLDLLVEPLREVRWNM